MKKIVFGIIFVMVVGFVLSESCTKKPSSPQSQSGKEVSAKDKINQSVERIDSMRAGIPYPSNGTMDTVFSVIGEERVKDTEMNTTFLQADSAWNKFKSLCSRGEYKEAYNYFYDDDENRGRFMVALKRTTAQYVFYTEVLYELDRRYDKENAMSKLVSNLNLNLVMTSAVIESSRNGYVPPHFPDLFFMSIEGNRQIGNYKKAKEIIEQYTPLVCWIEGKKEEDVERITKELLDEIDTPLMMREDEQNY